MLNDNLVLKQLPFLRHVTIMGLEILNFDEILVFDRVDVYHP